MLEIDEIFERKISCQVHKKEEKNEKKNTLTPKIKIKNITKFENELMKRVLSKSRFEQKRASKKM